MDEKHLSGCNEMCVSEDTKYSDFVRLHREVCVDDEKFEELLEYLNKYPSSIREITFFDGYFHSVPKIEVYEEFADKFVKRLPVLKQMGIRVGINHFVALGFFEQGGKRILEGGKFLVHMDGTEAIGKLCPNSECNHDYIEKSYSIIAPLNADFIYTDDDISVEYEQICCCDECLKKFEMASNLFSKNSMSVNRDNLTKLMEEESNRNILIDFHVSNIKAVYSLIEKTIHKFNPDTEIGFMQCNFMMKNELFAYAQTQSAGKSIRMRPGGGLYNDRDVVGIIEKATRISEQIVNAPSCIGKIEAEIENFPNQPLVKSEKYYIFECLNYLAHGCTGIAHSIFNPAYGYSDYETRFDMLSDIRNFGEGIVETFKRGQLCGANYLTGFSDTDVHYKKHTVPKLCIPDFIFSGIPFTVNTDNADVYVLSKENVSYLSDEEIKRAFEKSVFMTGEALEMLNNRGLNAYTGFEVKDIYTKDIKERDIESKFNLDNGAGKVLRDGAQAFYWFPEYCHAYSVVSTTETAENITELVNFVGEHKGYSMAVGYNKFGKKVAVSGYYPDSFSSSLSRQYQLREVFKWLSEKDIMVSVRSLNKIAVIQRKTEKGMGAVLLNYALDDAKKVVIELKNCKKEALLYKYFLNGKTVTASLAVENKGTDYSEVVLPALPSLSCGYIEY